MLTGDRYRRPNPYDDAIGTLALQAVFVLATQRS